MVLSFNGENDLLSIENSFTPLMMKFFTWLKAYDDTQIKMEIFEQYSAKNVTRELAMLLEKAYLNSTDKVKNNKTMR